MQTASEHFPPTCVSRRSPEALTPIQGFRRAAESVMGPEHAKLPWVFHNNGAAWTDGYAILSLRHGVRIELSWSVRWNLWAVRTFVVGDSLPVTTDAENVAGRITYGLAWIAEADRLAEAARVAEVEREEWDVTNTADRWE